MQLTIRQAADLLQTSESQVRRWIRDRGLPAVLFNEQYRLNRVDLLVWAQANQVPMQETATGADAGVSLVDALRRGGIHRDLQGDSCAAVLQQAVQRLQLPKAVDRDLVLEMILGRQAHGTTAIGHGIAIPHARYPIVAAVPEPIVGLAFLRTPLDFNAPDRALVAALFVLLTPTIRVHLDLLGRLARALTGPLLAPVQARADDAAILAAAAQSDAEARR